MLASVNSKGVLALLSSLSLWTFNSSLQSFIVDETPRVSVICEIAVPCLFYLRHHRKWTVTKMFQVFYCSFIILKTFYDEVSNYFLGTFDNFDIIAYPFSRFLVFGITYMLPFDHIQRYFLSPGQYDNIMIMI